MLKHLLIFLIFYSAHTASAKVLIATVAQVKNHVITSREIAIHKELDVALGQSLNEFGPEAGTEEVIREWLLFLEASTFYNSKVAQNRVNKYIDRVQAQLSKTAAWNQLGVSASELQTKVRRRLEAERIYNFKKKASVLPVSLSEIETEYTQNRIRYGNESFEGVKEKIRQNKVEENLQSRMEQWFLVLERKYKVQRFSKFSEF